jgi:maltoporin
MHTLGLAAALTATSAGAVDFDGYFRVGPGGTKSNEARACYDLAGTSFGGHYRLGNECNFYGEFGLTQTGTVGGVTYNAKVMFNEFNKGTDTGKSYSSFEQMYVEGKGFDISPGTNFWIGKRFYGRADVHILDKFFIQMDGVGAGADQIALGGGKLGVAYFSSDSGKGFGDDGTGTSTNPAGRLNVDYTELPVNPGGTLRITGTYTKGNFDNAIDGKGTSGYGISLQHIQEIAAIGGKNTAWLQYAAGSADLSATFGKMTAKTGIKQWRAVESVTWQVGPFGGQAIALYGEHDTDDTDPLAVIPKFKEFTIGGRASFAVTNNFKLIAETGYLEKKPSGSPTQKLAKFTFAPTLSTGPGFFNRPELRLYVTTAKWNTAANAAAGLAGLTGLNDGKTKGTSYGAQAEIWF